MMFLALNLPLNASDFNETGLLRVDWRDENRYIYDKYGAYTLLGWMTPYKDGKGVINIWMPRHLMYDESGKYYFKYVIYHELKHLKCWREEGNQGYIDNFVEHKGCFEK